MDQDNTKQKRWEIAVCEKPTVHIHYGTGSLHILEEDFLDMAKEIQETAEQFEALSMPGARAGKNFYNNSLPSFSPP